MSIASRENQRLRPLRPIGFTGRINASQLATGAVVVAFAVAAGLLAAFDPRIALLLACIAGLSCLLTLGRRLSTLYHVLMAGLLAGYAFLDKGFAYIGVYPVFVSEVVLLAATLHIAVIAGRLRFTWLHWLLVAFMVLGLFRTIPYVERDGIAALRDAALWGYGIFAVALSTGLTTKHFERLTLLYSRAFPLFLVWAPVAAVAARLYGAELPTVLGSTVSVLTLKSNDIGVHLAGVGAFIVLGLGGRPTGWIRDTAVWALWLVCFAIVGSGNRSGLLAAALAFVAAALVRPAPQLMRRLGLAILVAAVVASVAPEISLVRERTVSITQIAQNLTSIVTDTGDSELDGTKEWRQAWWNSIVQYTIYGDYFWTGKGFGVNLAIDDGFTLDDTGSLRSPHNSHLTVLARMGVPGLLLWLLLQAGFGASLLWAYIKARRNGADFWCRIDAWLFVYWSAMMVAASFDVYLEGPQGGVWFWSVVGLGLAAIAIQRSTFDEAERHRDVSTTASVAYSPAPLR